MKFDSAQFAVGTEHEYFTPRIMEKVITIILQNEQKTLKYGDIF